MLNPSMLNVPMLNVVLLRGVLSTPPEVRMLDSGSRVATLQVRVRETGRTTTSVPVAVWEPPTAVEAMAEGDEIAVLGRVHRRFFRAGDGRTGSRVEVLAEHVAPAGDRRRLAALLRRAAAALCRD